MRHFVLIDGRSGAGKTTYADQLGQRLGLTVLHLDSWYPGWDGLLAGSTMVARDVLHPTHPGYYAWDWEHDRRGQWVHVDPMRSLIIEGVGAVTEDNIAAARRLGTVTTLRVEADESVRRRRALTRDPGFAPWWQMWARQEEEFFAGPGAVAVDRVIHTDGGEAVTSLHGEGGGRGIGECFPRSLPAGHV